MKNLLIFLGLSLARISHHPSEVTVPSLSRIGSQYQRFCEKCELALLGDTNVQNIPQTDLKHIKDLFEELIDNYDYSYTIFGSKPMSLADFALEAPKDLPLFKRIRSQVFMYKRKARLHAWYKHRNEFDLKDFIFLDDEEDLLNCLVLILINKKNMLKILHENETIFKEELGDSFIPESFLEKLEKRETSLSKATNKSQRLMGIMLGYGVRNATLFQERYDIMKVVWNREKENLAEDKILTKKLADIEMSCGDFNELDERAIIRPLYFLADVSHPETVALQQKYERERQQIIELRKKSNFMDIVLQRLVASD